MEARSARNATGRPRRYDARGVEVFDPYRPPRAAVSVDDAAVAVPVLATRGARFAAACIDGLLQWLLVAGPFAIPILVAEWSWLHDDPVLDELSAFAGLLVVAAIQAPLVLACHGSLGKCLLGLVVRDRTGRRATATQLLVRRPVFQFLGVAAAIVDLLPGLHFEIARGSQHGIVSLAVVPVVLMDILAIFRADRRCWHDRFAGTAVYPRKSLRRVAMPALDPAPTVRTPKSRERRGIA